MREGFSLSGAPGKEKIKATTPLKVWKEKIMALSDKVEIPMRKMVVFFIIDTSGSMEGSKIGAVNNACRELIPELADLPVISGDTQVKVAVLEYSSGARWITAKGPIDVESFSWINLEASGITDIGAAFNALNEKLSSKYFQTGGFIAPVIIVTTDGSPTDDWKPALAALKQNKWFKAAIKVGVAIGDEADRNVLTAFTGSEGMVLDVFTSATIRKVISSALIYIDDGPAPVGAENW